MHRIRSIVIDPMRTVDAIGEPLVVVRHADIIAFLEPVGRRVAVVVVAAGQEVVVFDAHLFLARLL